MDKLKIYVAGPHVFWPDEVQQDFYRKVEALEEKHNFTAIIPKDGDIQAPEGTPQSLVIWMKNITSMMQADIIVADITPFRGVSCDVGTAFEIGFCAANEVTISMWSHAHYTTYKERVERFKNSEFCDYYGFPWTDCKVEDFGLNENLMLQPFDNVKIHATIAQAVEDGIRRYKEKQ